MFQKNFKKIGISPDSFKGHQNDPLTWAFLGGLDEELVTLIKQRKLNGPTTRTDGPAILANNYLKLFQREKKTKLPKS